MSMHVRDVRRLFTYDSWANARMVDCIRGLTEEQFTRRIDSKQRIRIFLPSSGLSPIVM